MLINKVTGITTGLVRRTDGILLSIMTEGLYGNLKSSQREIQVLFSIQNATMQPVGEYAQNCMKLLGEYDDVSIIAEEDEAVREAYFIGKLIDKVAFDIISKTRITTYYEQGLSFETENLN